MQEVLDFKRMDFKKIAPKERVLNFKEFTIPLDKKNKKFKVDDVWIVVWPFVIRV